MFPLFFTNIYINIYTHYIYIYIGLVSLFNGISTFVGYFNAKAFLIEEQ